MKKATIYFTEKNTRLCERKSRSKTIEVPDEMFNRWDWDGIVEIFREEQKRFCAYDSTVIVNKIKLGRAVLQG